MLKKRKILRVIAGIIGFIIVGALLLTVNSFVGNPISASIATSKIKEYVSETYPNLELEVSNASYNFKTSRYQSLATSRISEDTRFAISWRNGNIIDFYESEVENRFSTYRRLSEEFDKVVEKIIFDEFPYEVNLVIADFSKNDGDFRELELDMVLDIYNPPMNTTLTVWTINNEISYEILEEQLINLHTLMTKHRIPVYEYSLRLERANRESEKKDYDELYLYEFPSNLISQNDLIEVIREHQRQIEIKYNK